MEYSRCKLIIPDLRYGEKSARVFNTLQVLKEHLGILGVPTRDLITIPTCKIYDRVLHIVEGLKM